MLNDNNLTLAVVGTRRASSYGLRVVNFLVDELSDLNILIISGLAYGIDLAAHKAIIDKKGKTIAVLGEGIVNILKSNKKKIVEKIIENNGLIISEFAPSEKGLSYHFPLRNRIIAGLSDGIIIIEAPIDSGALITANYGLKYGKEIFVVPAEIFNKNFEGSHNLIKSGAKLVTSVEDILVELGINYQFKKKMENINLTPKEELICEVLKTKSCSVEELNIKTKLAIQELLIILTNLEIRGIIKNRGGEFYLV